MQPDRMAGENGTTVKGSFPRAVPVPTTARYLAQRLGGVRHVQGDADAVVHTVASPTLAQAGSLAFCRLADPAAATAMVHGCAASVMVVGMELPPAATTLIVVDDPTAWFIRALNVLFDPAWSHHIHPSACLAPDAVIGHPVHIGAGTVVEAGCRIGAHSRIGAHCTLGPGTQVGEHVLIQNHASLGGIGLGYHVTAEGERLLFPHLGAAVIGNHAVVGAGTVVVRGQMDDTVVGPRVRLGNLVNIGHNVQIAEDTVISSSSAIAGGARIGPRCNLGMGVMVNAKVQIGADCQVGLGTVVTKSLPAGLSVFGNPARPLPTMERF